MNVCLTDVRVNDRIFWSLNDRLNIYKDVHLCELVHVLLYYVFYWNVDYSRNMNILEPGLIAQQLIQPIYGN